MNESAYRRACYEMARRHRRQRWFVADAADLRELARLWLIEADTWSVVGAIELANQATQYAANFHLAADTLAAL